MERINNYIFCITSFSNGVYKINDDNTYSLLTPTFSNGSCNIDTYYTEYGNNIYVVYTYNALYYSTDCINWTYNGDIAPNYNAIKYYNGYFYFLGSDYTFNRTKDFENVEFIRYIVADSFDFKDDNTVVFTYYSSNYAMQMDLTTKSISYGNANEISKDMYYYETPIAFYDFGEMPKIEKINDKLILLPKDLIAVKYDSKYDY